MSKAKEVMFGKILRTMTRDGYVFKLKTLTRDDAVVLREYLIDHLKLVEQKQQKIWNVLEDGAN